MASAKDTFESNTFRANTFASGTWRGAGVVVVDTGVGWYVAQREIYQAGAQSGQVYLLANASEVSQPGRSAGEIRG